MPRKTPAALLQCWCADWRQENASATQSSVHSVGFWAEGHGQGLCHAEKHIPPHNKINGCADYTKATQAPHQAHSLMRCKATQTQKHQQNYSTATSTSTAVVQHCRLTGKATRQLRGGSAVTAHASRAQACTGTRHRAARWSRVTSSLGPSGAITGTPHNAVRACAAMLCRGSPSPEEVPGQEASRLLRRPRPGRVVEVHVHDAKPLREALQPLQVVHDAPSKVRLHLHTTTASHESVVVLLLHGISTATTALGHAPRIQGPLRSHGVKHVLTLTPSEMALHRLSR